MTERNFRFILGISLMVFLYFQLDTLIYFYIGLLIFEGVTNLRIPILISRLRFGKDYPEHTAEKTSACRFTFEAERGFRFVIAVTLIVTFLFFNQTVVVCTLAGCIRTYHGRDYRNLSDRNFAPLAGLQIMKKKAGVSDDWIRNWQASIAVKITAAVLYAIVMLGFTITVLSSCVIVKCYRRIVVPVLILIA